MYPLIVTLLFLCGYRFDIYYKKTGLAGLMSTAGKMNMVDFLNLMHIATIGLNNLIYHLLG